MSAQHTSGPWTQHDTRRAVYVTGPDKYFVCRCDCSMHRGVSEHAANARLIAAAPDLLEALDTALAAWDAIYVQTELQRAQRQRHASEICRAALAKAREG